MRLKLYEDAIRSKSRTKGDAKSIDPDDSDDSRTDAANPHSGCCCTCTL